MNYSDGSGGRVTLDPSDDGRVGSGATFYTFDMVQEELVEGMLLWRRAPDRERAWQSVRSFWPEIKRAQWWGDGDGELNLAPEERPEPRPLPLTRRQVADMERIGEWLGFVPEADRRLVVFALAALASGRARIPWLRLRRPLGVKLGADGLRKRYGAAIAGICAALNAPKTAEIYAGKCQP